MLAFCGTADNNSCRSDAVALAGHMCVHCCLIVFKVSHSLEVGDKVAVPIPYKACAIAFRRICFASSPSTSLYDPHTTVMAPLICSVSHAVPLTLCL